MGVHLWTLGSVCDRQPLESHKGVEDGFDPLKTVHVKFRMRKCVLCEGRVSRDSFQ